MNKYKRYCVGCGLCKTLKLTNLKKNERGFLYPEENLKIFSQICPISGVHTKDLNKNDLWGKSEAVYVGWSNNDSTRKRASSGGVLTEIACFLLESKKVDAVIHIGADQSCPTKTKVYFSTSPNEVVSNSGSRYCISSPLDWNSTLEENVRYAFIGKPCDVVVLTNYMRVNPNMKEKIYYILSFFCMGEPSEDAQSKLLEKLDCHKCVSLEYRGNGWPGYATAIDEMGETHCITYDESWGGILGRDLMPACKLCVDGLGELADISCGDAWYITEENRPDFTEHAGRNVIFARSLVGNEILQEMRKGKKIVLEEYDQYKYELPIIQKSQWNRKREMYCRILGMKLLFKKHPKYDAKLLKTYMKGVPMKQRLRITIGTCKRIIKGSF